jgi:hypothetical protein
MNLFARISDLLRPGRSHVSLSALALALAMVLVAGPFAAVSAATMAKCPCKDMTKCARHGKSDTSGPAILPDSCCSGCAAATAPNYPRFSLVCRLSFLAVLLIGLPALRPSAAGFFSTSFDISRFQLPPPLA